MSRCASHAHLRIAVIRREGCVHIRQEEERDWQAVHAVHGAAFETAAEADLVATLREHATPIVSLVAEEAESIIGHIMFSRVVLVEHPGLKVIGLAPMAVAPKYQRQGVGSALVYAGLDECRKLGFGAVVVLGHPGYYQRFGFSSSVKYGITCEYDVPADAFMVVELEPNFLRDASGKVCYHRAFDDV